MDLSDDVLAAATEAYRVALSKDEDPIRAAVEAAITEILKPVSPLDRYVKWSALQASVIYHERVRPKTYTLYDDAMSLTAGKYSAHNLFLLMSMLISQTLSDLYTTAIDMGNQEKYPTERDFISWYFDAHLKTYEVYSRRQAIIDELKPAQEE